MSKRLQVIMDDFEYAETQELARRHHQTTAEWVRSALRDARLRANLRDPAQKIRAIQKAANHNFPTGDLKQLNQEIQMGYTSGLP